MAPPPFFWQVTSPLVFPGRRFGSCTVPIRSWTRLDNSFPLGPFFFLSWQHPNVRPKELLSSIGLLFCREALPFSHQLWLLRTSACNPFERSFLFFQVFFLGKNALFQTAIGLSKAVKQAFLLRCTPFPPRTKRPRRIPSLHFIRPLLPPFTFCERLPSDYCYYNSHSSHSDCRLKPFSKSVFPFLLTGFVHPVPLSQLGPFWPFL